MKRAIKTLGTYTNKVQNMYLNYATILLNIGNTKNKRVCVRACLRAQRMHTILSSKRFPLCARYVFVFMTCKLFAQYEPYHCNKRVFTRCLQY